MYCTIFTCSLRWHQQHTHHSQPLLSCNISHCHTSPYHSPHLLSLISLISLMSVFTFVVGDICSDGHAQQRPLGQHSARNHNIRNRFCLVKNRQRYQPSSFSPRQGTCCAQRPCSSRRRHRRHACQTMRGWGRIYQHEMKTRMQCKNAKQECGCDG